MAPKKRKQPATRARTQRVVERDLLPETLQDLAERRRAAEDVCGACLLAIGAETSLGLTESCQHVFHFECAERWAQTENSCPQCKQRFSWLAAYASGGRRLSLTRVQKRDQEGVEDDEFEDIQVCERCKLVGDESALLLCDGMHGTCNAAFHLGCVGLAAIPRGAWFCPDCVERGFDVDSRGRRGAGSRRRIDAGAAPASIPPLAGGAASPSSAPFAVETSSPRVAADIANAVTAAGNAAKPGSQPTALPAPVHSVAAGAGATAPSPSNTAEVAAVTASSASSVAVPEVAQIGGAGATRRGAGRGNPLPSSLRLSALACVSPAVDLPTFRPAAGAGAGGSSVFASFVQRRRAQRGGGGSDAGGFIKLNPTYEQDFMGGKSSAA